MAKPTPDTPGADDPGPGRRLALDVGTVRIGVAVSDSAAMLASPVETVDRLTGFKDRDKADIDRLLWLIGQYRPVEIIIGLPRDLKANGSSSVKHAKEIGFRLTRRMTNTDSLPVVPVRFADERLTTVAAERHLRDCGVNTKKGRAVIDQAAACEILQSWLDARSRRLAAP
ncbi:Holliday junction resolvase RuvX [Corynebacterium mendelii]|uniref:Putative pre-16S rRNA nuclease n=1 Tax=Corynebacterium mendelii TaxID=2765362 RepID=A0A939IT27_9CORY|nr:Holliday junction resolvase RuvX [Corynebacterium mendelii]MBN9643399.1 Holliday junction resolvase RuvX [Corynebacterium mendelii]